MDLSIIIVNYKTLGLTLGCISSIKKSKLKVNYEIIVVNNCSDKLKGDFVLIQNKENLGFAKAVNQGITKAKGKYILLLNSDTLVKSDDIDKLYSFAKSKKDAAAVVPKLINPDGTLQASAFKLPGLLNGFSPKKYIPNTNTVNAAVMAAFLITPSGLEKIGLLNDKYFMYFEDLDYCRRIKKIGLKIYVDHEVKLVHYHGESGKNLVDHAYQWRRLIPSSIIYHGKIKHYLIYISSLLNQKFGLATVLIPFLVIPAILNLTRSGFFPMQDDLQAFRVYEMDKCFDDLQIPCRWVPDAGYQYGYPQFNFYPPLPYYIGAGMHRLGIQYIDSVKILFIFGYIASALTMYLLVSELFGKFPGFVAALSYTYIPYKAVEVYVRGALSEFWAQIFFPLIFWAIYKLIKSGKLKFVVILAISVVMLLTTHVLMSMIFFPFAVVWAVYFLMQTNWKNLLKLVYAGAVGFGLSAFFTLPLLFEKKFVHTEGLLSGYFDYRQHFVNIFKLFLSREWGYGSSGFPNEKLNLSVGIIQWVVGLVVAPVISVINFNKNRKLSLLTLMLAACALFSIFMIHMKSSAIWSVLPPLTYLQFPWRFLAVSIFILCLLTGIVVKGLGRYKYILGLLIIIFSFILTINYYKPKDWYSISDNEKFSGASWEKQLTISIFDYLPLTAKLPPITKAPPVPEVLAGNLLFINYQKGSDFQKGELEVKQNATVRLPLFDFPGMQVKIDGKVTSHINNNCEGEEFCLGLITFNIPNGPHKIEASLTNTPIRTLGNILTIISFILLIFLIFKSKTSESLKVLNTDIEN